MAAEKKSSGVLRGENQIQEPKLGVNGHFHDHWHLGGELHLWGHRLHEG